MKNVRLLFFTGLKAPLILRLNKYILKIINLFLAINRKENWEYILIILLGVGLQSRYLKNLKYSSIGVSKKGKDSLPEAEKNITMNGWNSNVKMVRVILALREKIIDRAQRQPKRQRRKEALTKRDRYIAGLADLQNCWPNFHRFSLPEVENLYQELLCHIPGAIYRCTCDPERQIAYISDAIEQISGYDSTEFINQTISSLASIIHWEDREKITQTIGNSIAIKQDYNMEYRIVRADGTTRWIYDRGQTTFNEKGNIIWLDGIIFDFTERKQVELELQQTTQNLRRKLQERTDELINSFNQLQAEIADRKRVESALEKSISLQRATLEAAVDGIIVVNKNGKITIFNQKFLQLWHIPPKIIAARDMKQTLSFLSHQLKDPEKFRLKIDRIHTQPEAESCDTLDFKDGRIFEVYSQPQRIGQIIVGRVWIFRDVTERHMAEETIRYQALHDLLTDLPNRILFNENLSTALANVSQREGKVAVMFLDLDRFKTINDTLGHTFGDQLLQLVADRLTECLWQHDTIARWGGDEFTILIPEIYTEEDASRIAQRILKFLKQPFHIEGHQLYISSSIGIAVYPDDGEDAQTLLRNADVALYRAKEKGRNNYQFYAAAMSCHASELLVLENHLHKALEKGEFLVYYQPQIDTSTGKICQMEALVRWQHPELGLISPAKFIPLAEETGLILQIGEWVLRKACTQNKAWQNAGLPPISVAVNLSARQFQQPNLAAMVARVLQETGLDPGYLELEITESVAMQNVDFSREMLSDLHQMGVSLAMDDFGTGYSSLSYLKKFPLDKLKIDKSFVLELAEDSNDAAIIAAIAALAKVLNLKMVAEGVETETQKNFLESLECEYMQGYLFSPPLSGEKATELLCKFCCQKTKISPSYSSNILNTSISTASA